MKAPPTAALFLAFAITFAGAVPIRVAAAGVEISWDRDLAFEYDRANYEKTLGEFVESARSEVSSWLGLSLTRPLSVKVLTPARYEAQFGSCAAWNQGAHYRSGTIHVNGGARLDGAYAGLIAHEMAHAVLDHRGTAARLPQWLNEGIAERLGSRRQGWERLDNNQVNELERALDQRTLLPLPRGGGLSRFGYLQSFAAVLFLEGTLGREKLLAVVRRTIERDGFERALEAEASWTMRNVEEGFVHWVDHLQ